MSTTLNHAAMRFGKPRFDSYRQAGMHARMYAWARYHTCPAPVQNPPQLVLHLQQVVAQGLQLVDVAVRGVECRVRQRLVERQQLPPCESPCSA